MGERLRRLTRMSKLAQISYLTLVAVLTQFQPEQHRDMFFSGRHVSETKRLGPHRCHLASLKVGWGHTEAVKFKEISEYANTPIIRSTFYRRTGCPGIGRPGQPNGTNTMTAGHI